MHVVCNDSLRKLGYVWYVLAEPTPLAVGLGGNLATLLPATFSAAPNCSSVMFSGNLAILDTQPLFPGQP